MTTAKTTVMAQPDVIDHALGRSGMFSNFRNPLKDLNLARGRQSLDKFVGALANSSDRHWVMMEIYELLSGLSFTSDLEAKVDEIHRFYKAELSKAAIRTLIDIRLNSKGADQLLIFAREISMIFFGGDGSQITNLTNDFLSADVKFFESLTQPSKAEQLSNQFLQQVGANQALLRQCNTLIKAVRSSVMEVGSASLDLNLSIFGVQVNEDNIEMVVAYFSAAAANLGVQIAYKFDKTSKQLIIKFQEEQSLDGYIGFAHEPLGQVHSDVSENKTFADRIVTTVAAGLNINQAKENIGRILPAALKIGAQVGAGMVGMSTLNTMIDKLEQYGSYAKLVGNIRDAREGSFTWQMAQVTRASGHITTFDISDEAAQHTPAIYLFRNHILQKCGFSYNKTPYEILKQMFSETSSKSGEYNAFIWRLMEIIGDPVFYDQVNNKLGIEFLLPIIDEGGKIIPENFYNYVSTLVSAVKGKGAGARELVGGAFFSFVQKAQVRSVDVSIFQNTSQTKSLNLRTATRVTADAVLAASLGQGTQAALAASSIAGVSTVVTNFQDRLEERVYVALMQSGNVDLDEIMQTVRRDVARDVAIGAAIGAIARVLSTNVALSNLEGGLRGFDLSKNVVQQFSRWGPIGLYAFAKIHFLIKDSQGREVYDPFKLISEFLQDGALRAKVMMEMRAVLAGASVASNVGGFASIESIRGAQSGSGFLDRGSISSNSAQILSQSESKAVPAPFSKVTSLDEPSSFVKPEKQAQTQESQDNSGFKGYSTNTRTGGAGVPLQMNSNLVHEPTEFTSLVNVDIDSPRDISFKDFTEIGDANERHVVDVLGRERVLSTLKDYSNVFIDNTSGSAGRLMLTEQTHLVNLSTAGQNFNATLAYSVSSGTTLPSGILTSDGVFHPGEFDHATRTLSLSLNNVSYSMTFGEDGSLLTNTIDSVVGSSNLISTIDTGGFQRATIQFEDSNFYIDNSEMGGVIQGLGRFAYDEDGFAGFLGTNGNIYDISEITNTQVTFNSTNIDIQYFDFTNNGSDTYRAIVHGGRVVAVYDADGDRIWWNSTYVAQNNLGGSQNNFLTNFDQHTTTASPEDLNIAFATTYKGDYMQPTTVDTPDGLVVRTAPTVLVDGSLQSNTVGITRTAPRPIEISINSAKVSLSPGFNDDNELVGIVVDGQPQGIFTIDNNTTLEIDGVEYQSVLSSDSNWLMLFNEQGRTVSIANIADLDNPVIQNNGVNLSDSDLQTIANRVREIRDTEFTDLQSIIDFDADYIRANSNIEIVNTDDIQVTANGNVLVFADAIQSSDIDDSKITLENVTTLNGQSRIAITGEDIFRSNTVQTVIRLNDDLSTENIPTTQLGSTSTRIFTPDSGTNYYDLTGTQLNPINLNNINILEYNGSYFNISDGSSLPTFGPTNNQFIQVGTNWYEATGLSLTSTPAGAIDVDSDDNPTYIFSGGRLFNTSSEVTETVSGLPPGYTLFVDGGNVIFNNSVQSINYSIELTVGGRKFEIRIEPRDKTVALITTNIDIAGRQFQGKLDLNSLSDEMVTTSEILTINGVVPVNLASGERFVFIDDEIMIFTNAGDISQVLTLEESALLKDIDDSLLGFSYQSKVYTLSGVEVQPLGNSEVYKIGDNYFVQQDGSFTQVNIQDEVNAFVIENKVYDFNGTEIQPLGNSSAYDIEGTLYAVNSGTNQLQPVEAVYATNQLFMVDDVIYDANGNEVQDIGNTGVYNLGEGELVRLQDGTFSVIELDKVLITENNAVAFILEGKVYDVASGSVMDAPTVSGDSLTIDNLDSLRIIGDKIYDISGDTFTIVNDLTQEYNQWQVGFAVNDQSLIPSTNAVLELSGYTFEVPVAQLNSGSPALANISLQDATLIDNDDLNTDEVQYFLGKDNKLLELSQGDSGYEVNEITAEDGVYIIDGQSYELIDGGLVLKIEDEVTPEVEVTAQPEVTPEPEITIEPEVTPEPEVTLEAGQTEPEITPETEVTPEPEVEDIPTNNTATTETPTATQTNVQQSTLPPATPTPQPTNTSNITQIPASTETQSPTQTETSATATNTPTTVSTDVPTSTPEPTSTEANQVVPTTTTQPSSTLMPTFTPEPSPSPTPPTEKISDSADSQNTTTLLDPLSPGNLAAQYPAPPYRGPEVPEPLRPIFGSNIYSVGDVAAALSLTGITIGVSAAIYDLKNIKSNPISKNRRFLKIKNADDESVYDIIVKMIQDGKTDVTINDELKKLPGVVNELKQRYKKEKGEVPLWLLQAIRKQLHKQVGSKIPTERRNY